MIFLLNALFIVGIALFSVFVLCVLETKERNNTEAVPISPFTFWALDLSHLCP